MRGMWGRAEARALQVPVQFAGYFSSGVPEHTVSPIRSLVEEVTERS